jgi:hypothetical protein
MTAATLTALPGHARLVPVPDLTIEQRTAEIEGLASSNASVFATVTVLLAVAHPSLTGAALWDAWNKAEQAIAVRDATSEDDGDYGMYEERAGNAICDLVHGINISTARGSGDTGGIA